MNVFVAAIGCSLLACVHGAAAGQDAVRLTIHADRVQRSVPPGVVGWGAQWNRASLWPAPPPDFATDGEHRAYLRRLADANRPLLRQADVRHLSWPWGVTFSTFGVNWENSARPWSRRVADCVRGSGWCEKAVVGVGDLLWLAEQWKLEAVTVAVPLAVFDGNAKRWGPRLLHDDFDDPTIEKIADHAAALVEYLRQQPGWKRLQRVYLSAGCEWRRYKLREPSSAVLTYAKLLKRLRQRIADEKVWIVGSGSDSADLAGAKRAEAINWNRPLYDALSGTTGIAIDLHRYRGSIDAVRAADHTMPLTPANIDRLHRVGVSQRRFLTLNPEAWGGQGPSLPTVLLENAILGFDTDHRRRSDRPRPWPVTLAHADLVREALGGPSLAFLGWTWFPQHTPPEWPFDAMRDGKLQPHAEAQAFLSEFHRGGVLAVDVPAFAHVRANATRDSQGVVHICGGNFSIEPRTVQLVLAPAARKAAGAVELLTAEGRKQLAWDGLSPLRLPAACLWRVRIP